jgi:hypothetical protein
MRSWRSRRMSSESWTSSKTSSCMVVSNTPK